MSIEEEARKIVRKKKEFQKSLGSFASTALIFVVIMFFIPGVGRWMLFGLAIWGISIIGKGIKLYSGSNNANWEEREYQKEMKRLRRLKRHNETEYDLEDLSKNPSRPVEKQESKKSWDEEDFV